MADMEESVEVEEQVNERKRKAGDAASPSNKRQRRKDEAKSKWSEKVQQDKAARREKQGKKRAWVKHTAEEQAYKDAGVPIPTRKRHEPIAYGTGSRDRVILVSGYAKDTKSKELREVFKQYGQVTAVDIRKDVAAGHKPYAMISYETAQQAITAAAEGNGCTVDGCVLTVKPPKEREDAFVVFVGHIPKDSTPETVKALFEGIVPVVRVSIPDVTLPQYKDDERHLAFVSLNSAEDCRKAVAALNGKEVDGVALLVARKRNTSRLCVHVRGMPADTSARDFRELFKECGTIDKIRKPPTWDHVDLVFTKEEEAAKAAATVNGMIVGKTALIVELD
eukprot:TRINITY_DN18145_c0_g1_i1.p1 TRINITY_DN18145_c0_g1~~TRINITY_DN18145_c0_g1_i1.p1  ORF type:complete len:350 (+),score=109.94 TRINITY_DN18145_c0_g1_i1:45-1052(+)